MSYFIYIDLISSLLDPRLVDLGSALIYVGTYGSKSSGILFLPSLRKQKVISTVELISHTPKYSKILNTWYTSLLFVKVYRTEDSKGSFSVFESSCHRY